MTKDDFDMVVVDDDLVHVAADELLDLGDVPVAENNKDCLLESPDLVPIVEMYRSLQRLVRWGRIVDLPIHDSPPY
jgi:hypothetical protein